MPQTAVDPIVGAAQLVTMLQTLASREVAPKDPVVVTVGSLHAGTTFNVIPDRAELHGTVRALDEDVRRSMPERMERPTARALRGDALAATRSTTIGAIRRPSTTAPPTTWFAPLRGRRGRGQRRRSARHRHVVRRHGVHATGAPGSVFRRRRARSGERPRAAAQRALRHRRARPRSRVRDDDRRSRFMAERSAT